jgi:hypothetical protein
MPLLMTEGKDGTVLPSRNAMLVRWSGVDGGRTGGAGGANRRDLTRPAAPGQ